MVREDEVPMVRDGEEEVLLLSHGKVREEAVLLLSHGKGRGGGGGPAAIPW